MCLLAFCWKTRQATLELLNGKISYENFRHLLGSCQTIISERCWAWWKHSGKLRHLPKFVIGRAHERPDLPPINKPTEPEG